MISKEYSFAISQVLDVLNHTKKEDVDKISPKFISYLKENEMKTYVSTLDFSKPLSDMNLTDKAIGILAVINKKYWLNDKEIKIFEDKLKQNEIEFQKANIGVKNIESAFGKINENVASTSNTDIAICEDKKWYQKLLKNILALFKK